MGIPSEGWMFLLLATNSTFITILIVSLVGAVVLFLSEDDEDDDW